MFNAECGMRLQMYDPVIMSPLQRNGGSPLSTRMHRTIAYSIRPTRSITRICLWSVSSRELLSDVRLLAIRFEVFVGVFNALIVSPIDDTDAERNDG